MTMKLSGRILWSGKAAALAAVFLAVGACELPAQSPDQSSGFVPGRLLVKFRREVQESRVSSVLAGLRARRGQQIGSLGIHLVSLPAGALETEFLQVVKALPEVEFAELDRIVPPAIVPNDPYYANWEWHLQKISAPAAWDTT